MKDFELFEPKASLRLQEYLFKEKDKKIDRFRTPYAYMGVSNAAYELGNQSAKIGQNTFESRGHHGQEFSKILPDQHLDR